MRLGRANKFYTNAHQIFYTISILFMLELNTICYALGKMNSGLFVIFKRTLNSDFQISNLIFNQMPNEINI